MLADVLEPGQTNFLRGLLAARRILVNTLFTGSHKVLNLRWMRLVQSQTLVPLFLLLEADADKPVSWSLLTPLMSLKIRLYLPRIVRRSEVLTSGIWVDYLLRGLVVVISNIEKASFWLPVYNDNTIAE